MLHFARTQLTLTSDGNKAGEIWAIVLSEDGQYLAATSFDGRINVWDDLADGAKIREFETKGSFGMSIDLVGDAYQGFECNTTNYTCSLAMDDSLRPGMRTEQFTSLIMIQAGCYTRCPVGETLLIR